MPGTPCACRFLLAGDKVWYTLLCDEIKDYLPKNFLNDVHNTVRGLGLVTCGKLISYAGNYSTQCDVRIAMAAVYPKVFIPDATGKASANSKIRRENLLNLGSESFLCPVSDTEELLMIPGLRALLEKYIAIARKKADGMGSVFHVFHVSNGYVL